MAVVIKLLGTPWQEFNRPFYLVSFDPLAEMLDPKMVVTTRDIKEARRFDSPADAVAFWQTQHKRQPRRLDGAPNRPLTKYTVEFLKVDDAV